MGLLPSLKISFEKPSLDTGIHEDVKNLMKKPPKPKKDELPRFWTLKERALVGIILGVTILLIALFWFKGGGDMPQVQFSVPSFDLGGFGINQTIEVK